MQIQAKKPYNEINITPLVDLTFVLLIIFILLTTAAVQGVKVDLPSASAAKALEAPKARVIAVANDGTVSIDAVPVSMSELEGQLRTTIGAANPASSNTAAAVSSPTPCIGVYTYFRGCTSPASAAVEVM